jgi:hypothetical protein
MQTVIQKSLHFFLTRMPAIIDLGKPIATIINHSPQPANILPDIAISCRTHHRLSSPLMTATA